GDTFVLGPCPERTAVAALVLTANEIPYTIVVHERQVAGYGPPTAHIAVEIEHEGEPYWFDFGWRETRFLRGRYVYKADIEETIQLLRSAWSYFDAGNMTSEQAFEIVPPRRIEMDEKLAWYCSQLSTITDDLLQERLVFDPRFSVYAATEETATVAA